MDTLFWFRCTESFIWSVLLCWNVLWSATTTWYTLRWMISFLFANILLFPISCGLLILYWPFFILRFLTTARQEYYRLAANLAIGMTLFLIISYIYPNGLNLRPEALADTNIFTHLVNYVYSHDTPTNVFPSIHVFNSIACCCAITNCPGLKKKPFVRYGSVILTISIILSTMF